MIAKVISNAGWLLKGNSKKIKISKPSIPSQRYHRCVLTHPLQTGGISHIKTARESRQIASSSPQFVQVCSKHDDLCLLFTCRTTHTVSILGITQSSKTSSLAHLLRHSLTLVQGQVEHSLSSGRPKIRQLGTLILCWVAGAGIDQPVGERHP